MKHSRITLHVSEVSSGLMTAGRPEPLTKGEKEMREARRRYVLAYLRCARAAVDEIGKLLADSHIDEDAALEMMAEVKELYF